MEKGELKLKQGLELLQIETTPQLCQDAMRFLGELLHWGRKINLTAVRSLEEGIERHLLDSLVLLDELNGRSLLDIGSGAGLPCLPLAIAKPEHTIESVESVGKKINFQRHIRRLFDLKNFQAHHCRIENFVPVALFDQITARAFASVEKIITLSIPHLAESGELLLLRGRVDESATRGALAACAEQGLRIEVARTYNLPFSDAERHLLKIIRQ